MKLSSLSEVMLLDPDNPPWLLLGVRPLRCKLGDPTWSCLVMLDLDSLNRVSWRADFDLPSFWVNTSLSLRRALFSWTIFSNARDPTKISSINYFFIINFCLTSWCVPSLKTTVQIWFNSKIWRRNIRQLWICFSSTNLQQFWTIAADCGEGARSESLFSVTPSWSVMTGGCGVEIKAGSWGIWWHLGSTQFVLKMLNFLVQIRNLSLKFTYF